MIDKTEFFRNLVFHYCLYLIRYLDKDNFILIESTEMNYTKEQIELFKTEIKTLITNYPKSYYFLIQKKPYLLDFINENTSWIDNNDGIKFNGRIFFLLNDIKEYPKCEMCGKPLIKSMKANKKSEDYIRHCSAKCANNNPVSKERLRATNLKKYGVEIVSQSNKVKETYRKHMEEKYGKGIVNSFQAKEVIEKLEKTKLLKYGSKTYNNRHKSEQTCLKKYGVRVSSQAKSVIQKNIRKHCYRYNNVIFDSTWEVAYYIWLKDHNIQFVYHPKSIKYFDKDNKSHWYHPDFLVENQLIEIKGDDQFDKNGNMIDKIDSSKNYIAKAKQQCILGKDISIYLNYIKEKYGNLKTFFKSIHINK